MSGEPPSDITTKNPFQDVTEQSFTFDYEYATHSTDMEDEEGKTDSSWTDPVYINSFFVLSDY